MQIKNARTEKKTTWIYDRFKSEVSENDLTTKVFLRNTTENIDSRRTVAYVRGM